MHRPSNAATRRRNALRVVLAVGAGFGFTTAVTGLFAAGLPLAFGMDRAEAALLCSMLGFLLYLGVLLWAFTEPRLARVGAVLGGGGIAAFLLARGLGPAAALAGG